MSKKSILEQALLQVQDLEEAVKANAKGILASTMKEELNELLKESMEEEEVEGSLTKEDEQGIPPVAEQEIDSEDEDNDDETSINDEPTDDEDPDLEDEVDDLLDTGAEDEESDDEMDSMFDAIDSDDEDEDVLDMTDASDDEVLKVFKSMKPEDGIVVKRDGDNVELEDGDDEYIIKLDDQVADEVADEDLSEEEDCTEGCDDSDEDLSEEDEVVYEIDLDENEDEVADEDEFELEVPEGDSHEGDVDEAARTKSNVHGNKGGSNRAGIDSKKKYAAGAINEEVKTLRKQNGEYKKALILFKEKLNEVAVFNANLAYSTRLFTEHSTTRNEKLNILKRFDTVDTLTESKSTYKTIKGELESSKNVTESVVNKITSNNPTTSSSQDVLSESKAYESPQFSRMKELMSKIK